MAQSNLLPIKKCAAPAVQRSAVMMQKRVLSLSLLFQLILDTVTWKSTSDITDTYETAGRGSHESKQLIPFFLNLWREQELLKGFRVHMRTFSKLNKLSVRRWRKQRAKVTVCWLQKKNVWPTETEPSFSYTMKTDLNFTNMKRKDTAVCLSYTV